MRDRRLTVPVLASVLSVIAILATAGAVFACDWRQLHITAGDCSIQGGAATRTWTVQNAEAGYTSEWSTDASFSAANTTSFTGTAVVPVTTPATVDHLYLRFANDHSVMISKDWDGGTCPKAAPTLNTTPGAGGGIGTVITDKATLAGGYTDANSPTGSITFKLYGPNDLTCHNDPIKTWNVTVAGNGDYSTSPGYVTLAAGTYEWTASYGGDSHNSVASSGCAKEAVVIDANSETGIATVPIDENTGDNAQTAPDEVHDTATLTGVTESAGGTVTYSLYACGTDQSCTTPVFLRVGGTKPVTNGVVTKSDTITLNDAGYYCWLAVYSGDDNNKGATSRCQAEIIVVGEEHQEGETSTPFYTPPPTSSGTGSSSSTMPLIALLICFAFGGLGIAAIETQRRSIRR